ETVVEEGKGKKKTFQLFGIYDSIKEREDGRKNNGYVHSIEEKELEEYVYKFLLERKSDEAMTYQSLATEIGFIDKSKLMNEELNRLWQNILDTSHTDTKGYNEKVRNSTIKNFALELIERGESVVRISLSNLVKEGRLKTEEIAIGINLNGDQIEIKSDVIHEIREMEEIILKRYNLKHE